MPRFVVFVGPRGSGKTTLGHALGRVLDAPVYDTDRMVEDLAGEPLSRLWEREGEEAFRNVESRALTALLTLSPGVVSTGGGIVVRPENRQKLRKLGYVIYLHVSEEQLLTRLSGGSERRPRLRQGISLEEEVRQVIRERDPLYREVADHVLSVGGASIAITLEEILSVLRPLASVLGKIP
ncbi:MAG: shikimate kinase [Leptospirillia bacterium]